MRPAPLPPGATIGIVGGGQLGRMSALAAARLGYRCHILTPEADSPAAQVAAAATVAPYEDQEALARFADAVDVVTFEFENIPAESLALLAARKPTRPSPEVLRISQDRLLEKAFLNRIGVATAPWAELRDEAGLARAIAAIGTPAVLKTTRLGYDGKGQAMIRSPEDAAGAIARLHAGGPLVLEGFVDFACEVSVVVARGLDGAVAAFDVVENRHRHHILDLTLAPAAVAAETRAAALAAASKVAAGIGLEGLLALEMFVTRDGRVLANEIAPRPHNSGHWTIDACAVSQFEQHIRAVAGLPLGDPARHSDAIMKNLIGDDVLRWPAIVAQPGLIPHLYGKAEARPGRKMGHVTRLFPLGALPQGQEAETAFAPAIPPAAIRD
ncbi:MAG: 5-(carboxyamino)imidazole ribonucleotide synthase [Alphaproteobacteria bacterium]|nr:5-(carboxyamino)imidazole ribonucleotide synthase [Alphaproteobacteria bacterium]